MAYLCQDLSPHCHEAISLDVAFLHVSGPDILRRTIENGPKLPPTARCMNRQRPETDLEA
jgi:hypothetical protein